MRRCLFAFLLLTPFVVHAADSCTYEAPRNLKLDLAGVRSLQVEVRSFDLHLSGSDSAKDLQLTGRACASDRQVLDSLVVTQRREGDRLMLELGSASGFHLFGGGEADLEVNLHIPASLPVVVAVGSGAADVSGVRQLESHVGSGDLHVNRVAGPFAVSVGSGDVVANDIGSLALGSMGSGDLKAEGIRGDAKVGSIGSGDVELRKIDGSVRVDTLGSGDLTVRDVRGGLSLGAKGSGDVNHSGIGGKVEVPRDDD